MVTYPRWEPATGRKGSRVLRNRLAVVDEHELFRRGVLAVVREDPWLEVVHESHDGPVPEAADVIIASPRGFRDLRPSRPVVVCWGPSDPPLTAPSGWPMAIVERDTVRSDELLGAVRALAAGLRLDGSGSSDALDPRRRHILQLLSEGADTRGISESLYYSERTVKGLIRDIEEQLSARNRVEAVAKGIRLGLI
jgi:DNA-binding NarL/FixJ family response regulator